MTLIGYQGVAKTAALAAAAGEHVLLVGPPGTGKSAWAQEFFSGYEGEVFSTQLSRWADETVLFGPPNLRALREKGEIRYAHAGLLAAHWAYLDELFDASDVLLRTLLGVLNERVFARGSFAARVPLQTAIATANFSRVNEVTEAVVDRFLFRCEAPNLTAEERLGLWDIVPSPTPATATTPTTTTTTTPATRTTLEDLASVRQRARFVHVSDRVRQLGAAWARKLGFSPRREAKAAWACRVVAAMRGAATAQPADLLAVLPAAAPLTGDLAAKQAQVAADLRAEANRLDREDQQLDEVARCQPSEEFVEPIGRLKALVAAMRRLQAISPVSPAVEQAQAERLHNLEAEHGQLLRELGVLV